MINGRRRKTTALNRMDANATAVVAIVGLVVSVGGSVLAVINHTRIRSMCCGRKLEVSLDVDKTSPGAYTPPKTPKNGALKISAPNVEV